MSGATFLNREQRIVRALGDQLDDIDVKALRARALDLPVMIRRHGLLQVLLYLKGKDGAPGVLRGCLHQGIAAALGQGTIEPDPDALLQALPDMPLPVYLLHWEAGVEAASWLKRLVEARTASQGEVSPEPTSPSP